MTLLMSRVFFSLMLPAVLIYGPYIYADTGPVATQECTGESITLDHIGLLPGFYSDFESRVMESRRAFSSANEGSCKTVSANKLADDSVLVDVRISSQATEFGLNNVVNVPVHELKTKKFLKKRTLVLLDETFRYYELLEECRHLKALGFGNISVLEGGVGSLSGFASTVDIDAVDFHALKQRWRWLVFDLTGSRVPESDNLVSLDPKSGKQLLSAKLGQGIENFRFRNGFHPHVLILDQDGRNYAMVHDAIAEKYRPHVFYLKGGLREYQNFILGQNTILQQKKHINSRSASPCGSLN